MSTTFKILGSGNSAGVPTIGNHWGACDPDEPKNRRSRPCSVIRYGGKSLVIDTGPDFRHQINDNDIQDIAGVFFTHAHGDHVNGIDDLRIISFFQKRQIPVYGSGETLDNLQGRFPYLFAGSADGLYSAVLKPKLIAENQFAQPMEIEGVPCTVFEQDHGSCASLGIRIGDTAYSTDMIRLDEQALGVLRGVRNWIVDGAGYKSETNPVHANLETVYSYNETVQAERVIVMHLTPSMDYKTLCEELPDGYEPAYDGLEVMIEL